MAGQQQPGIGIDRDAPQQRNELADLDAVVFVAGKNVGGIVDDDQPRPDIACRLPQPSKSGVGTIRPPLSGAAITASLPASDRAWTALLEFLVVGAVVLKMRSRRRRSSCSSSSQQTISAGPGTGMVPSQSRASTVAAARCSARIVCRPPPLPDRRVTF